MKKTWIYILSVTMLGSSMLTSCDITSSRNYMGTMAGAEIGGVVGEALGWMSTSRHDGPGKAMLGSIIGTVAGAAIGNAITRDDTETTAYRSTSKQTKRYNQESNNAGYQTGGGYDDTYSYNNSNDSRLYTTNNLIISGVTYQDEDGDGRCSRNETLNIIYDVKNVGTATLTDVVLNVEAVNNEKSFALSPSNTVRIAAGETIRYKAKAFCKNKPSDSVTQFKVSANSQTGGNTFSELQIRMSK